MVRAIKRWPVIRHLRWALHCWAFADWWNNVGCYLGALPNPDDTAYLELIWRGKL